MTGHNGRALDNGAPTSSPLAVSLGAISLPQFSSEKIRELVAALEVPFDPSQIEWRVMNTAKNGQSIRGQVVPYADQRAYTDRLNALFTPAGWTRRYTIHTSANFERSKDQKIVAKVLVTCELTIFGLGSHSATGEEWADDDNAGTAAEAQAFKRACSCFGLGRYLYHFSGSWVDLDQHKRPKSAPQLAGWATPEGWREGLRPRGPGHSNTSQQGGNGRSERHEGQAAKSDCSSVLGQIERMEQVVGKRMYRGLLKTVARVWNPKEIHDPATQQKVLAHMQAAGRGLRRLDAALESAEPATLETVLRSLKLSSVNQIDDLKTLREIVVVLEAVVSPS